jgi:membrane protease YdiL (CAAX protease family)
VESLPEAGFPPDSWSPPPGHPEPSISRWFAAVQVFLVCGVPTQVLVYLALLGSGKHMGADGSFISADPDNISLEFFATASLLDTALVALLIRIFLGLSGEASRDVFLDRRRVISEAARGVALIPLLWILVVGVVLLIGAWMPRLHNVPHNPLERFMDTPVRAAVFLVVVVLAGGVREELQRGFILHRFAQRLGGAWTGLALFSLAFGAFHAPQGIDVAIAVGLLGVIWGVLYIRRGSVVTAMVSHAGFDVAQVLQQVLVRTLSS